MVVFPPIISFSNKLHLGIVVLFRSQNKITEENFKIAFSLLIPIMIIRTLKTWNSRIHISSNFLFITISKYVSATKVKSHDKNSVHKFRNYLRISKARTRVKSGWKCSLKRWSSATRIVPAWNTGLWRSDLLSNCREIFPVAPRLSHASNASDESRTGL